MTSRCFSAHTVVVINETQVSVLGNDAFPIFRFNCTAVGSPSVRFLSWETAAGAAVNITRFRTFIIRRFFEDEIVVEAFIEVAASDCIRDEGYVCLFDDGEDPSTIVRRSSVIECPITGRMVVSYL